MGETYRYHEMKIQLTAGGQDFTQLVVDFDLWSRRVSPVKILECAVGNLKAPAGGGLYTGKVKEGDTVSLTWGPDQEPAKVFSGTVSRVFNTKAVKFIAVDDGQKLLDTITTKNTADETTSQIVKRLAQEAGLNPGKVSTALDVHFHHWFTQGRTVHQALGDLKRSLIHSHGLDVESLAWWVDMAGSFHFGTWEDKDNGWNTIEKALDLSNKVNISELDAPTVKGKLGRVLTHPWPYFDHSQEVNISDDRLAKVSDTFWIDSVHHYQRGSKARTELFIRVAE